MKRQLFFFVISMFLFKCKKQDIINPQVLKSPSVQIFPLTKYVGDPTFKFEFNSLSTAPFKISSTNQSVATILKDSIKVIGVGTSKIELTQDVSETFSGITLSTELTVKNRIATIIDKIDSYVIYIADGESKLPIPKSNSKGDFLFKSSDPNIAKIVGLNILPIKVGKVKITISQKISGENSEGQNEFEIEIRDKIDFSQYKLEMIYSSKNKDEIITDFFINNDKNIVFSSYTPSPSYGKYDHFVSKIDKNGNQIIIGKGVFKRIDSIEPDSKGNIFVSDGEGNRIYQIDPSNIIKIFAGNGTSGSNDGLGTVASFNFPKNLRFDKNGDLIVSDYSNHTIRKIKPNGQTSTIAGIPLSKGSFNGDKSVATFLYPSKISINNENEIFVSDGNTNGNGTRIRKIDKDGNVSTYLGSLNAGDNDGDNNSASFYAITDLYHRKDNILLIGDFYNIGSTNYSTFRYANIQGVLNTALNLKTTWSMRFFEKDNVTYVADVFGKIYKLMKP